jgi:hypothetical protein
MANLIERETSPAKETIYLDIDLSVAQTSGRPGMRDSFKKTAVYRLPSAGETDSPLDVILYLPGVRDSQWSGSIKEFFHDPRFTLREEVAQCRKKNFVLVGPTLPDYQALALGDGDFASNYLEEEIMHAILNHTNSLVFPDVGDVILAAHSGGGWPLAKLVNLAYFKKKVREVWCFDCLYSNAPGGDAASWIKWVRAMGNSLNRLVISYVPGTGTASVSTALGNAGLSNVSLRTATAVHPLIPKTYIKSLIDSATCLTNV